MPALPASEIPASVVTRLAPHTLRLQPEHDPAQGALFEVVPRRVPEQTTAATTAPVTDCPELHAWATRFSQAVVEVVAGNRPPSQLVRWTSRTVYRDLERRTRLAQRAATTATGTPVRRSALRPQVRSVHVCQVAPDAAEASVHVRHGHRSRAIALRLESTGTRWTCTAIEFA
jgi:hypothetical protein